MKQVTGKQVWDALKVIDRATESLCESLIAKHGTSRLAAESIGVSPVHFCNMRNGHANASLDLLEVMSAEVDE